MQNSPTLASFFVLIALSVLVASFALSLLSLVFPTVPPSAPASLRRSRRTSMAPCNFIVPCHPHRKLISPPRSTVAAVDSRRRLGGSLGQEATRPTPLAALYPPTLGSVGGPLLDLHRHGARGAARRAARRGAHLSRAGACSAFAFVLRHDCFACACLVRRSRACELTRSALGGNFERSIRAARFRGLLRFFSLLARSRTTWTFSRNLFRATVRLRCDEVWPIFGISVEEGRRGKTRGEAERGRRDAFIWKRATASDCGYAWI